MPAVSAEANTASAGQMELSQWEVFHIYGPRLISALFSSLALGIVWSAIFGYLYRYPRDGWSAKIFVMILGILTTTDSVLTCYNVVEIAAVHAGDIPYAITNQTDVIEWVRGIFAISIQQNPSRTRLIYWFGVMVLMGLALVGFAFGIANPAYLSTLKSVYEVSDPTSKANRTYHLIWNVQFISLLVLDAILTILFSLKLQKSRTGFAKSNRVIDVLILVLLRNGLLMTLLQLAVVILMTTSDQYSIWIFFPSALISKVYVLTVVAMLTKPRDTRDREDSSYMNEDRYTGGSSCKTCQNRLRSSPTKRGKTRENSSGLTFTEILHDSYKDFVDVNCLEKGKGGSESIDDTGNKDGGGYLDIIPGNGVKGDLIIQIDTQEDTSIFVSPSDYSPQATRQPRLGVMGVRDESSHLV